MIGRPPTERAPIAVIRGALGIVQPDVTKVGGLSEQVKIAWMAREFGVCYLGHGWNTARGFAADLQLASEWSADGQPRGIRRRIFKTLTRSKREAGRSMMTASSRFRTARVSASNSIPMD
jgi:L-alanine-DL-glutamate epimerase-like enolase superfamily enzyme